MSSTKKPATKAFDIHKPGKSAPDASGRSTIVNNHQLAHDPMMRDDNNDAAVTEAEDEPKGDYKPHVELKLKPLHEDVTADEDTKTTETEADDKPANSLADTPAESPVDDTEAATEPETIQVKTSATSDTASAETTPPEPDNPPAESEPTENETESASDDAKPESAATKEASEQAAERAAVEQADKLRQMADSRKYYLPINQVRRRHVCAVVLSLAVSIVVALIIIDLALDANLFTISGVQPVTNFLN